MPIRSAQVPDYPVFARLYEELETGDPTPAPQTFEHDLMADVLVFERDGDVVGYTYFQVLDGVGTIRHIVTDTQCRGQGVGRALMAEVAARVRAQGSDRWCLNVKPDNQPAVALYTRMGMQFQYASVAMRMGW
nr:GNAT family N-acetyltransferase [Deltaproteobacteria bacterium]